MRSSCCAPTATRDPWGEDFGAPHEDAIARSSTGRSSSTTTRRVKAFYMQPDPDDPTPFWPAT